VPSRDCSDPDTGRNPPPLSTVAEETPINIQTDLEGQHHLVEKGGTTDKPTLVLKRRSGQHGFSHYIKRELDCAAHTVGYLVEGESMGELNAATTDSEASPIKEGSIPDQLANLVCPSAPAEPK
jgi:hypothetical protein